MDLKEFALLAENCRDTFVKRTLEDIASKTKLSDQQLKAYLEDQLTALEEYTDNLIDQDAKNAGNDRLPSEMVMEHLNAWALIRDVFVCLGDPKKQRPEKTAGEYGYFPGSSEAFRNYRDKLAECRGKKLSVEEYQKLTGLLVKALNDTIDTTGFGGTAKKAFRYDRAVLRNLDPAGSNKERAAALAAENTFEGAVTKGRENLRSVKLFHENHLHSLDQFLYEAALYIEEGHSPEKLSPAEIDKVLTQRGLVFFTEFRAPKDKRKTLDVLCDYVESLIGDEAHYKENILYKNRKNLSFSLAGYLLNPEVRTALSALKRKKSKDGDYEYFRGYVKILADHGLVRQMKKMALEKSDAMGTLSLSAIKTLAEKDAMDPKVLLISRGVTDHLKEYFRKLRSDAGKFGDTKAYDEAVEHYEKAWKAYAGTRPLNTAVCTDLQDAITEMSLMISYQLGDYDLSEVIKKDIRFLSLQIDMVKEPGKGGLNTPLAEPAALKPMYLKRNLFGEIPSSFERALCMMAEYLKNNDISTVTEDLLEALRHIESCRMGEENGLYDGHKGQEYDTILSGGFAHLSSYFQMRAAGYGKEEPFTETAKSILSADYIKNCGSLHNIKDLTALLGKMKTSGDLDKILEANRGILELPYLTDEQEDMRTTIEKCQKLFAGNPKFAEELTTSRTFGQCYQMAEGHSFSSLLEKLQHVNTARENFTPDDQTMEVYAELVRSMSMVFNYSLDADAKILNPLVDIMMQIKKPNIHLTPETEIDPVTFMNLVDLFSGNPLTDSIEPIIENFNKELVTGPTETKVRKTSKNVYDSKFGADRTFGQLASDIFRNGKQGNLPFRPFYKWKMEDYNKQGHTAMSDDECVHDSLVHYQHLASYLPIVTKFYEKDQQMINAAVGSQAKAKAIEENRRGNMIMSDIINLQAHDRMNSPSVESSAATELIRLLPTEYNASYNNKKLSKKYFEALSSNVCFDERAGRINEFAANRMAIHGTPLPPAEDGSMDFRTVEKQNLVITQAVSSDNLMLAVMSVLQGLKDDYEDTVPLEHFTASMVRPVLTRTLVGLSIEKHTVSKADVDLMLDRLVNEMMVLQPEPASEQESLDEIAGELNQMGYSWRLSWTEHDASEAREYAERLFGWHRMGDLLKQQPELLNQVLRIPGEKELAEIREKAAKDPKYTGPKNDASEASISRHADAEKNFRLGWDRMQNIRWEEMEDNDVNAAVEARADEYRNNVRPQAFRDLFNSLLNHYHADQIISRFENRESKEALEVIKKNLKKSDQEFAEIFKYAGGKEEDELLKACRLVLCVMENRSVLHSSDHEKFEALFPAKELGHYSGGHHIYMEPALDVHLSIDKFTETFEKLIPRFSLEDTAMAEAVLKSLHTIQDDIVFARKNNIKIDEDYAAKMVRTVRTGASLAALYLNPADLSKDRISEYTSALTGPLEMIRANMNTIENTRNGIVFKVEDLNFMPLNNLAGALNDPEKEDLQEYHKDWTALREKCIDEVTDNKDSFRVDSYKSAPNLALSEKLEAISGSYAEKIRAEFRNFEAENILVKNDARIEADPNALLTPEYISHKRKEMEASREARQVTSDFFAKWQILSELEKYGNNIPQDKQMTFGKLQEEIRARQTEAGVNRLFYQVMKDKNYRYDLDYTKELYAESEKSIPEILECVNIRKDPKACYALYMKKRAEYDPEELRRLEKTNSLGYDAGPRQAVGRRAALGIFREIEKNALDYAKENFLKTNPNEIDWHDMQAFLKEHENEKIGQVRDFHKYIILLEKAGAGPEKVLDAHYTESQLQKDIKNEIYTNYERLFNNMLDEKEGKDLTYAEAAELHKIVQKFRPLYEIDTDTDDYQKLEALHRKLFGDKPLERINELEKNQHRSLTDYLEYRYAFNRESFVWEKMLLCKDITPDEKNKKEDARELEKHILKNPSIAEELKNKSVAEIKALLLRQAEILDGIGSRYAAAKKMLNEPGSGSGQLDNALELLRHNLMNYDDNIRDIGEDEKDKAILQVYRLNKKMELLESDAKKYFAGRTDELKTHHQKHLPGMEMHEHAAMLEGLKAAGLFIKQVNPNEEGLAQQIALQVMNARALADRDNTTVSGENAHKYFLDDEYRDKQLTDLMNDPQFTALLKTPDKDGKAVKDMNDQELLAHFKDALPKAMTDDFENMSDFFLITDTNYIPNDRLPQIRETAKKLSENDVRKQCREWIAALKKLRSEMDGTNSWFSSDSPAYKDLQRDLESCIKLLDNKVKAAGKAPEQWSKIPQLLTETMVLMDTECTKYRESHAGQRKNYNDRQLRRLSVFNRMSLLTKQFLQDPVNCHTERFHKERIAMAILNGARKDDYVNNPKNAAARDHFLNFNTASASVTSLFEGRAENRLSELIGDLLSHRTEKQLATVAGESGKFIYTQFKVHSKQVNRQDHQKQQEKNRQNQNDRAQKAPGKDHGGPAI